MTGAQFMTEKAAGSDVGEATLTAVPDGDVWRLYGEKWFCSHADAEVALLLARPEGAPAGTRGLGLFAMPRRLDDGSRNHYRIGPAEGQARHQVDGVRRDRVRGRGRLCGRRRHDRHSGRCCAK